MNFKHKLTNFKMFSVFSFIDKFKNLIDEFQT